MFELILTILSWLAMGALIAGACILVYAALRGPGQRDETEEER